MTDPSTFNVILRELGVGLAGIAFGLSVIAMLRFRVVAKTAEAGTLTRLKIAGWVAGSLGAFALFQGATRALLILSHEPLDYRDFVAIILQINSILLLSVLMKTEGAWKGKQQHDN